MTQAELDNIFTYHKPFGDQNDRYIRIRELAKQFAAGIVQMCPSSREQSLAITKIQEATMCANAAIAINEKPEEL